MVWYRKQLWIDFEWESSYIVEVKITYVSVTVTVMQSEMFNDISVVSNVNATKIP